MLMGCLHNQTGAGGNEHHIDNKGQGGNAQPSSQNGNRSRVGNEHFAQNSPQGGYVNYRMTKF